MPAACWTDGKIEHSGGGVHGYNTATVTYPSGGAAGHLVLMWVTVIGTVSTPSGWTLIESVAFTQVAPFSKASSFKLFGKVLDGTEPSTFTLSQSGGDDSGICWAIVRVEALLDGDTQGGWFDDMVSAGPSTNALPSMNANREGNIYFYGATADDDTGLSSGGFSGSCQLEVQEIPIIPGQDIILAAKRIDASGPTGAITATGTDPRCAIGVLVPVFVPLATYSPVVGFIGWR